MTWNDPSTVGSPRVPGMHDAYDACDAERPPSRREPRDEAGTVPAEGSDTEPPEEAGYGYGV